MAVSGLAGKTNISGVDVDIELPEEIYAGAGFLLKVRVINKRKFLPAFLIGVKLEQGSVLFPFIGPGQEAAEYMQAVFDRRGRHPLGNIFVRSVFPFNFFIRFRKIRKLYEAIVFPRAGKCELWSFLDRDRRQKGEQASGRTGYEGDIISFRNYAAGDPFKYIHWKGSAKTGELKIKELSSLTRRPVIIDFDGITAKNTEEKVSFATYTILKLFRQNIPVGLDINGRLYKANLLASHKVRMLKELALYGIAPEE